MPPNAHSTIGTCRDRRWRDCGQNIDLILDWSGSQELDSTVLSKVRANLRSSIQSLRDFHIPHQISHHFLVCKDTSAILSTSLFSLVSHKSFDLCFFNMRNLFSFQSSLTRPQCHL